ncbi:MAG: HDIG domain-containing protein, partial [Candidatus Desulforudis sp.]|nr:HDIG domain-containing protein [Desulforudis sp.]
IVCVDFFPQYVRLQVGQVSPRTITARETVTFEDQVKTEEARQQVARMVAKQYDFDPRVTVAVRQDITVVTSRVRDIQQDDSLDTMAKVDAIDQAVPFPLPSDVLASLAEGNPAGTAAMEKELTLMVTRVMERGQGVAEENLDDVSRALAEEIRDAGWNRPYELMARNLMNTFLRPNAFYNPQRTEQLRQAAMDQVSPVLVTLKKNEKIIGEGEIVTAQHLVKLQAAGLLQPPLPFKTILGTALLIVFLTGIVIYYMRRQHRELFDSVGHLYLLGIIVLTVMVIGKVIVAIQVTQWPEFGSLMGYAVPLAAAGMLVAILLDFRLGLIVVAVLAILVGVMTGNDLRFALVGFLGGMAGVFSVSKLSQRTDLVRAGVYVAGANILAIFTVGLLTDTSAGLLLTSSLILGTANGLLSSVLANGGLPFLESSFRITSAVKLLELANPNQPLLKRLLLDAPGTYHHSILVGNLAEAGAEAVGADPILVRVGAYYHDVGKIRRPYFFIENQLTSDNPHDKITPALSTLVLTAHVKDGVESAREYKLPQAIIDLIEQHHGTSLITFFYHKALQQDEKNLVREEDFRYDGPKPQTKEAALIMLADTVEAAVRSVSNPTPGQVEGMIRKVIRDKLDDGQLDECDVNFRELELIALAFARVFTGIFHSRIEYPDAKEIERRKARNERRGKQPARHNTGD